MTTTVEAIAGLREAVRETANADDVALRDRLTSPEFGSPEVVSVPGERTLAHVAVQLVTLMKLAELEAAFGRGRLLPRSPEAGQMRTVIFDDPLPSQTSANATLLAELDNDDFVERLVIRRDVL